MYLRSVLYSKNNIVLCLIQGPLSVSERGNVSLVDGCEDIMRNSAGSFPLNNSGADLVRFIYQFVSHFQTWFMHIEHPWGKLVHLIFFFLFFSSLF